MTARGIITGVAQYLTAVAKHWYVLVVGLIGGSLGLVDLVVGSERTSEKLPQGGTLVHTHPVIPIWLWLALMGAGLLVAQFLAWSDMRRERDVARAGAARERAVELKVTPVVLQPDARTTLQLACLNEGAERLNDLVARIIKIESWDASVSRWVDFYVEADHFRWDGPGVTTSLNSGSQMLLNIASTTRADDSFAARLWRFRTGPNPHANMQIGPADADCWSYPSDNEWVFGKWRFQVAFEADGHRTQVTHFGFEVAPPPDPSTHTWNLLRWSNGGSTAPD